MSLISPMAVEKAIEQDKRDEQSFKDWKHAHHFWSISKEKLIGKAAADSQLWVTRHLLTKGCGGKALIQAIEVDDETAVQTLVNAGCNVNNEIDERCPLIVAVTRGNLSVTKILVEGGADVDISSSLGVGLLTRAVWVDDVDIIKFLLKSGADIEHESDNKTALMAAAYWNRVLMAKTLIKEGAGLNVQNREDSTALEWTVREKSLGVLQVLITSGADLTVKGKGGRTALEWAQERNYGQIISILQTAMDKQKPAKVQKSTEQWTVFDKNGSKMVTHTQYDAVSRTGVKDVFNFSTRMLLTEMKSGDDPASLATTYFKDLDPEVLEQAETKLSSSPKPKPARFKKHPVSR